MSAINPVVAQPKKLMTAMEFWEFVHRTENEQKSFELRRGEVIELSRPTRKHGIVAANVVFVLELYARQVRLGYVAGNDSGVLLSEDPDTVVGPDVGYFTDANTFAEVHPKWGEEVPVVAVEVLSPNDKMSVMNEKVVEYLKSGVKIVWVVDYENKMVSIYRTGRTLEVLKEADSLSGGDELPGFSCAVSDFFRLPGERPPQQLQLPT